MTTASPLGGDLPPRRPGGLNLTATPPQGGSRGAAATVFCCGALMVLGGAWVAGGTSAVGASVFGLGVLLICISIASVLPSNILGD